MIASIHLELVDGGRPLPDHNASLGAAVYTAFGELFPREAKDLHDDPRPSPYVLSEIYPTQQFADRFWFQVGSTQDELGKKITSALVAAGKLRVGQSQFVVEGYRDVTPRGIQGPIQFHTLSPLLLRDPVTRYCYLAETPGQPDTAFATRIEAVANHALKNELPDAGEVEVGVTIAGIPRKRDLHGRFVYAQPCRFYMDGSPEALTYLASRGIGWSRTHAFGFIAPHRGG